LRLANQARPLDPLHQPGDGVVAFLQEFRQFGDGGPAAAGYRVGVSRQR
jgi:hypothetical protein